MRIAIATDQDRVASHFGRCQTYTMVDLVDEQMTEAKELKNPGHAPGVIPEFLHGKGVDKIICGGIGMRATELFAQYDMEVFSGVTGSIQSVLEELKEGTLQPGESMCTPGAGRGYGIEKVTCDHDE